MTVQDWLKKYRQGGIENLLATKHSSGRPRTIPPWAEKALLKKLEEEEGMKSYGAICHWLAEKLGIEAKYATVHKLVYYRLQGSPKVARPKSQEQCLGTIRGF